MDTNENILKWFNGEISDETAQKLLAAEEFEFYKELKDRTGQLALSPADLEANYEQIKTKKAKKGIITLRPKTRWLPYVGIAASLALLFGLYQVFFFSQHLQAGVATTETFTLPDHSIVTIDAGSEISYANAFILKRKLKLNGTAYFEVQKGKTFTVCTEQGNVTVLGTKFDVISAPDYFQVNCYEGKVAVNAKGGKTILTAETSLTANALHQKMVDIHHTTPQWMRGITVFESTPYVVVIQSMEKRFGVSINFPDQYKNEIFTGGFPHDNLDKALQAVTLPLNLNYTINNTDINIHP
jgi:ferric-dicitrate binding protein FerR (iron transport regulator)